MKKLILAFILVLTPLTACAFDLSASPSYVVYRDGLESSPGIKVRAGSDLYLWGSYEDTLLRLAGQEAVDISLAGVGIGARKKFDGLSVFVEAGYYTPSADTRGGAFRDGAMLEMNRIVGVSEEWTHYEYDLKDGIGGTIGLSFDHRLSESWTLGLSASYRYLRLGEWLIGHNGEIGPDIYHWVTYSDRDFSAYQIGITLAHRF